MDVAEPSTVLDAAPVAEVNLALAKFGNLALNDVNRLVEALGRAAAEWSSPRLRLTGYSTLESEQDPSIWVDLDGDLDALHTVVRGVHEVAKGLRLFVDRRVFQPRVRLGSVRPTATESELEDLLADTGRVRDQRRGGRPASGCSPPPTRDPTCRPTSPTPRSRWVPTWCTDRWVGPTPAQALGASTSPASDGVVGRASSTGVGGPPCLLAATTGSTEANGIGRCSRYPWTSGAPTSLRTFSS